MGLPFTLLILRKIKLNKFHNLTSFFYLILIPILIQLTARFIIEPLFWLYITNENSKGLISSKYINFFFLSISIYSTNIFCNFCIQFNLFNI